MIGTTRTFFVKHGSWLALSVLVLTVSYANLHQEMDASKLTSPLDQNAGGPDNPQSQSTDPIDTEKLTAHLSQSVDSASETQVLTGRGAPSTKTDARPQVRSYTVKKDEDLKTLAQRFGISQDTIIHTNNLDGPEDVSQGDRLQILPVSGVAKSVEDGNTSLQNLADKYDVNVEDIKTYNNLEDEKLAGTQNVIVPNADIPYDELPHKSAPNVNIASHNHSAPDRAPASQAASEYYAYPTRGRVKPHTRYKGVDISNIDVGTPVRAAAPGVVVKTVKAGWGGGYGRHVVIKHPNGTKTLYGHLSNVAVDLGAQVDRNQYIGGVGNTGRSTGPHLHFEVHGAPNPLR